MDWDTLRSFLIYLGEILRANQQPVKREVKT
jgi:hypothetical protein